MSQEEFIRTSRLSDAARQEVLDRLDGGHAETAGPRAGNERKDPRWSYRQSDIAITVEHPGGGVSRLLLFARNLSAGGISFVHNGFLYPNSVCKVALPQTDGQTLLIASRIIRCRHVQGLFHEIGLKFDRRIDPALFLGEMNNNDRQPTTLEVPELLGRIAVVESNKAEAALMQHFLKLAGISPNMLHTSGALLDLVKLHGADIVLCELNIAGYDGVELVTKLRQGGFTGPIAVVTAETDELRLQQAKAAGANHIMAKPYNSGKIISLIVQMNQEIGAALPRTAVFSSADDPGMTEIISGYIEQARQTANLIEQATGARDLAQLRQLCMSLKGSAPGYGYPALGELADRAVQIMETQPSLTSVEPRLRTICSLCRRLRLRPGKSTKRAA